MAATGSGNYFQLSLTKSEPGGTCTKKFVISVEGEDVGGLLSRNITFENVMVDTDSSRKLREEFAKTCFETLLQYSYISGSTNEAGTVTKLAVISLLKRCKDVVKKYAEDEKLTGKCPLPRPRLAEMAAVLKAVTTLVASLKKAPQANIEVTVWEHVIDLYPFLVECTTSPSPSVCKALRDALMQYTDLLTPPNLALHNGK